MRGIRLIAATTSSFIALAIVACSNVADPPLIFAAASLVDVMGEIGNEYQKETGQTVRFSFGGSNLLANQINAGAPANAVIVAGDTPIRKLIEGGKAKEGDAVQIFTNRLVAVISVPPRFHVTGLVGGGRIAMPDPSTSPAGEYFEVVLKEIGIWYELQDQIVPTLDVRAALAAVTSGNVAYALVYETDALSTEDVIIADAIDDGSEATIPKYYASRLSEDHAADRFIEFLASPQALLIIERYGFSR